MHGRARDVGFDCSVAMPSWSLSHTNRPVEAAKAAAAAVVAAVVVKDVCTPNWRN